MENINKLSLKQREHNVIYNLDHMLLKQRHHTRAVIMCSSNINERI